jgi:hypothetical protein
VAYAFPGSTLARLQLGGVELTGPKRYAGDEWELCAKGCKSVLVIPAWEGLHYYHIWAVVLGVAQRGQTVGADLSVDGEDPRHRRAPPWSVRWAPTPDHTMP